MSVIDPLSRPIQAFRSIKTFRQSFAICWKRNFKCSRRDEWQRRQLLQSVRKIDFNNSIKLRMSSASVSKIPVAKNSRMSPERPSPVMSPAISPQKSYSKLPIKVQKAESSSSAKQYKENIYDVRWSETASPMMSPSRIPGTNATKTFLS